MIAAAGPEKGEPQFFLVVVNRGRSLTLRYSATSRRDIEPAGPLPASGEGEMVAAPLICGRCGELPPTELEWVFMFACD